MKKNSLVFTFMLFFSAFVVVLTNGCHGVYLDETQASEALENQRLRIGLYLPNGGSSLDETLLKAFIRDYRLHAELTVYKSNSQILKAFKAQQIEMAITRTSARHIDFAALQGPAYEDLELSLFCPNQQKGMVYVPDQFQFIKKSLIEELNLNEDSLVNIDEPTSQVLERAYQTKNACFVAESKLGQNIHVQQKKYRKLWTSDEVYPQAWIISKSNEYLNQLVQVWFQNLIRQNKMIRYKDQFDAPNFKMSLADYQQFKADVKEKLPSWKRYFQKFSQQYQIPWTLIAAVAYQESKWLNHAESFTGVKGLMQITEKTAQHLGIQNREDPLQSIQGGSYYLAYLYDKTPATLTQFERWAQALAAYNVGWGHLRDLHRLAKDRDLSAYRWNNLKNLLPELEREENDQLLENGLARGNETVDFIEHVFHYHEALNQIFPTQQLPTSRDV